jgi:hypothetical protein
MIYKTLHRKLNIEQHELHLKPEWSEVPGKVSSSCFTDGTRRVTVSLVNLEVKNWFSMVS